MYISTHMQMFACSLSNIFRNHRTAVDASTYFLVISDDVWCHTQDLCIISSLSVCV